MNYISPTFPAKTDTITVNMVNDKIKLIQSTFCAVKSIKSYKINPNSVFTYAHNKLYDLNFVMLY